MSAAQEDEVMRLLLINDSVDQAEQLSSMLRNGGVAVRPHRPESIAELSASLAERLVDLVVADLDAKSMPIAAVIEAVTATGKDVPVLAVSEKPDIERWYEALAAGAEAFIALDRPDHLLQAMQRSFERLQQRRRVRRLEAMLRETERRCDSLINSSREPIAYIHEGMHVRANEAYLETFGYESFDDVEGLPVLDMIAPSHAAEFKALLKSMSKGEPPPKQIEIAAQRSDGSSFDAQMEFSQATYEGEPCLQVIFRQQLVDAGMAAELDALRSRDATTGLFNRQHFLVELDAAMAAATAGTSDQAMLIVEIDHFESLLNELGVGHADMLLAAAAQRLAEQVSEPNVAARFTDDSFAVLTRGVDHVATRELAERLRKSFADSIVTIGSRSLSLTVSIGGVQIEERVATVPQVLGKASHHLQSAIDQGGNSISLFDPAARDRAEEERIQEWVERIRAALTNDEMLLHFQPIVSLQGESSPFYECLLRMRGESGDVLQSANFVGIAQEHGLMAQIDRWSLLRALALIRKHSAASNAPRLMVKLSTDSLQMPEFVPWLVKAIAASGIQGDRLVLSVPESKAFTNLHPTQSLVSALSPQGVTVAIDRFGVGLNSFDLLNHIDAKYLKIDRSLIENLARNNEDQVRVGEIAQRARDSGRVSIAEWVQDAPSMTALFSKGVDYVQGNFLAAPAADLDYDFG